MRSRSQVTGVKKNKWILGYYLFEGNGTPLQYSCLGNPTDGEGWQTTVHRVVKSQTRLSDFTFTFHFHALEKEMAPHSSTHAWEMPWTEEPGRLQSIGSWRVRHNWVTLLSLFTFMHWRRKWQPTPVFLPGESKGWEPGGLPSMGSHRVGHDWCDLAAAGYYLALKSTAFKKLSWMFFNI